MKPQRKICEVIEEKYFDELKVKLPKYLLTERRTELNVPQFNLL